MIAIQEFVFFGPPPAPPRAPAISALVAYLALAAIANLRRRVSSTRGVAP